MACLVSLVASAPQKRSDDELLLLSNQANEFLISNLTSDNEVLRKRSQQVTCTAQNIAVRREL